MLKLFRGVYLAAVYLTVVHGLLTPTSQDYTQSLQLDNDGKYIVYWLYNDTHITFEVHVLTRGYVGFGISPNGNMYPSDVVIGWVKDGKTYFSDRHTTAHAKPEVDKQQDWILLHGEENDMGTILKFARKLDTCDPEDRVIDDQTVRLIYSYHPDDPTSEDDLVYHGFERRGTKSVSLLSSSLPPASFEHEEIKNFEFRARNYVIPDKDTTYLCTGFQMPDLGGKHHMIEFEPVYTPGMEHFVHHLVIMRCPGKYPHLDMASAECMDQWPKGWPRCPENFIVWATGGGPFYLPENAGFSVGAPDDYSFYVMQTHYNNPMHKSGMIDSSGMRMKLTSKLRQHDVHVMTFAHSLTNHVIPPHEPDFITRALCVEECTENAHVENNQDITVIGGFLHAHLLGYGITLRHFRNGTELAPMMDDPNYDFFFQEVRPLRHKTIKAGDSFILECTYNTMQRSEVAFGGYSTREEMCAAELYVYPKTSFKTCVSRPLYDTYNATGNITDNAELHEMFVHMNWYDQNVKNDFYKKLADSTVLHTCIYNENGNYTVENYRFVENIQPFNRTAIIKPCSAT